MSLCVEAQEVKMARLLSETRGSFDVIVCFLLWRSISEGFLCWESCFCHSSQVAHTVHRPLFYVCNSIVCFIMLSMSSMQRHGTDGCVIALYNLQNHNYHFCEELFSHKWKFCHRLLALMSFQTHTTVSVELQKGQKQDPA